MHLASADEPACTLAARLGFGSPPATNATVATGEAEISAGPRVEAVASKIAVAVISIRCAVVMQALPAFHESRRVAFHKSRRVAFNGAFTTS
jgi:hypothetical protein|eukprot:m.181708 g.181708  ORF g.181708 m.181708 type:complete len:92 (+) comp24608_c1_seq1:2731-3006(+)